MHRLKNIKYEMSTFLKVMGEFLWKDIILLKKKKNLQKNPNTTEVSDIFNATDKFVILLDKHKEGICMLL